MELSLRQRIFMIIGIIAGIILAIVLYIMYAHAPNDTVENEISDTNIIDSNSGPQVNIINVEGQTVQNVPQIPAGEIYVKKLARIFTERFSTYSNQNNNIHITEVLPLVTEKMSEWIVTQGKIQSKDYIGITTQVLSSSLRDFDDEEGIAHVDISARQMLMNADTDKSGRVIKKEVIKKGVVDFIKEEGEWKVDGLWWNED